MKNQEQMIVLGLAGLAVYMIVKSKAKTSTSTTTDKGLVGFVSEILNSGGKAFDNGWRYFSDGTAIDPSGNYYLNGQMVWQTPTSGSLTV